MKVQHHSNRLNYNWEGMTIESKSFIRDLSFTWSWIEEDVFSLSFLSNNYCSEK